MWAVDIDKITVKQLLWWRRWMLILELQQHSSNTDSGDSYLSLSVNLSIGTRAWIRRKLRRNSATISTTNQTHDVYLTTHTYSTSTRIDYHKYMCRLLSKYVGWDLAAGLSVCVFVERQPQPVSTQLMLSHLWGSQYWTINTASHTTPTPLISRTSD